MKRAYPIFYLLLFIAGCQPITYVQLFKTKATSPIKANDGVYVFENDTVKITYDLWEEHGVLSFKIYNKLNVPIYIDWRKCSYVRNEQKLDYWSDVETTNASTEYKTYTWGGSGTYYNNGIIPGSSTVSSNVSRGSANTTAVKTKPERITFLAPKSEITRKQFKLFPEAGIRSNPDNVKYIKLKRNDDTTKITTVMYRDYNLDETPLTFRNFLTFSTAENFTNEFYVDNGFYLYRVSTMDVKHFEGKNSMQYDSPFVDSRYFYTYLDIESSGYYNGKKFKEHSK